jgi:hypothetical protein
MHVVAAVLIILSILLVGTPSAEANVLRVPDDYTDIQLAMDAADQGDTVLVSPGTYYENINFGGKSIVVGSHFLLAGDRSYVNTTVISGATAANVDSASCVTFCSGEDSASVLIGFTITGGEGTNWVDPQNPQYTWRGGGGVFVYRASPTVAHNLITDNTVVLVGGVDGAQGGGFLTYDGNPLLLNNVIVENRAEYGCGVVVDYSGAVIRNNLICRNSGGQAYGGGGIWCLGNGDTPAIVENNTIADNAVTGSGTYGGRGGGMFVWYGELTARNNIIWGNTQSQGGAVAEMNGGTALITYSDVQDGFDGEGNIDADPVFATPKYVLDGASPAVDTGNPAAEYNDPEDPGDPGHALWPSQGDLRNDMGCYGGPLSSVLAAGTAPAHGGGAGSGGSRLGLLQICPNPFRGDTIVRFTAGSPAPATVCVFDVLGREVAELRPCETSTGEQNVRWDASGLPSGVYLVRLRHGEGEAHSRAIVASAR